MSNESIYELGRVADIVNVNHKRHVSGAGKDAVFEDVPIAKKIIINNGISFIMPADAVKCSIGDVTWVHFASDDKVVPMSRG